MATKSDNHQSVWRSRNFQLVIGGGLVNDLGDWVLVVSLPIYVFVETGSGAATSAVLAIELLVALLASSVGGSLADRLDLRRVVVATNLLQAVALLPLLLVTSDRLWPLYIVTAVQSLLRQINNPASFALVPRIVADDQLVQANAANAFTDSLARLIGSPVGGIAVAFGGLTAIVIVDLLTFLFVALAVWFVDLPQRDKSQLGVEETPDGIRAGLQAVRGRRDLKAFLAADMLAEAAFALFPIVFVVFVVDELGGDGSTIGLMRGVAAFGGILASFVVAKISTQRPWVLMSVGFIGLGLVDFAFANLVQATTFLLFFYGLFALSGLPNVTSQVGANSTLQLLAPPEMLGRLAGLRSGGAAAAAIAGTVGAGLLIDRIGSVPLYNLQAGLYMTGGAVAYLGIIPRHSLTCDAVNG